MHIITIGIDPAVTSTENSDLTGIVVCGYDKQKFYIPEDRSGKYHPSTWAKIVSELYKKWNANTVVVETNQGGDLLTENIKSYGSKYIHITETRAKNAKRIRAEPIATLYSQNLVHHIQKYKDDEDNTGLIDLENEMLEFTGDIKDKSPDRLDAMVHGMQYLLEKHTGRKVGRFTSAFSGVF